MQPYTPHGDSNIVFVGALAVDFRCNLIPLTGTVTLLPCVLRTLERMQPYTPHGDSNGHRFRTWASLRRMQPYTPHGDSNSESPLTMNAEHDATLYPSRGQ